MIKIVEERLKNILEQKLKERMGDMEFKDYRIQFYLCILRIELKKERDVNAPKDGPEWLLNFIDYLFSEYSNSRDELYQLGLEFAKSTDFDDLKTRLTDEI